MQSLRLLSRAVLLAAVSPVFSLALLSGCGDSDQKSGTVVETPPQVKEAENAMENFMKNQDAAKKK